MTTLTAERDRLKKIEDASGDYEGQTRKFSEAFDEITAHYPADITQNNQLLFLKSIEDEFGIRIASASYTEPETIYRFQYLAPGNNESYSLIRSTVQFPMRIAYSEWKRFITYIEETDGCDVIESVMADYDETESLVDVDVTISQYAIKGDDRQDTALTTDVETGTDNIFFSNAVLSTGEEDFGEEEPVEPVRPSLYNEAEQEEEETSDGTDLTEGEDAENAEEESLTEEAGGDDDEGSAEETKADVEKQDAGSAKGGKTGIRSSIR